MSHAIQILKNPPDYTMRYIVQPGWNTKNEMHELHEFHANHSQNVTPYNSQSVVVGTQLTLPNTMGNSTIFPFQKV